MNTYPCLPCPPPLTAFLLPPLLLLMLSRSSDSSSVFSTPTTSSTSSSKTFASPSPVSPSHKAVPSWPSPEGSLDLPDYGELPEYEDLLTHGDFAPGSGLTLHDVIGDDDDEEDDDDDGEGSDGADVFSGVRPAHVTFRCFRCTGRAEQHGCNVTSFHASPGFYVTNCTGHCFNISSGESTVYDCNDGVPASGNHCFQDHAMQMCVCVTDFCNGPAFSPDVFSPATSHGLSGNLTSEGDRLASFHPVSSHNMTSHQKDHPPVTSRTHSDDNRTLTSQNVQQRANITTSSFIRGNAKDSNATDIIISDRKFSFSASDETDSKGRRNNTNRSTELTHNDIRAAEIHVKSGVYSINTSKKNPFYVLTLFLVFIFSTSS